MDPATTNFFIEFLKTFGFPLAALLFVVWSGNKKWWSFGWVLELREKTTQERIDQVAKERDETIARMIAERDATISAMRADHAETLKRVQQAAAEEIIRVREDQKEWRDLALLQSGILDKLRNTADKAVALIGGVQKGPDT